MPRLSLAVLFATVLAAAPALAVVNTIGDVKPVAPGVLLPIGQPGIDDDVDEVADWIDSQGNSARLGLADPNNVGGSGNFPGSYGWLDSRIWVNYDTTQNILVGEDGYGQLEINGGSQLRYQHLVLGGVSDQSRNQGDLSLTTTGSSENYNYLSDIADISLSRNGYGVLTVTGVGSVFNNDPNLIPADLQAVINFANGDDIGNTVTSLDSIVDMGGIPVTTRPDNGDANSTYDVHVGLLGGGELNVLAGGRVEIQDALQVATASTSSGTVTVDGAGSYLAAYGRSEFDGNTITGSQAFASYIGGNGNATMTVSGSGRSDFFNGLSIGAANSSTRLLEGIVNEDAFASGSLLVTGAGSTVSVAPTLATSNAGDDLGNDADLAIGELRDLTSGDGMDNLRYTPDGDLVNAPDGTSTLGQGLLRIEDGGRVNVSGDGDVGVGYHGTVEVRNGTLSVNGDIINDGRISGYGSVRGLSLDTTVYSTLIGGDPDAQQGNPSTAPLQITLVGDSILSSPTFTNRGSVAGLVELDVTGDIDNRGNIDIGGDLNGRSLITTVDSRLNGDDSYGSPLRIRLASTAQADQAVPAFRNRGALTGEIDLVTAGGVVNGDDLINGTDSNGGVIDASGTIMSGTFINHGKGSITVGAGKSLSILATGTEPGLDNSLSVNSPFVRFATILEDGTSPAAADGEIDSNPAAFFQANLGNINVDGGSIELGRLTDSEPTPPFSTLHVNLFRNARFVDFAAGGGTPEETIGTITSSDGEVRFRDGVYNTGVMAFTGGDNVVGGEVINAGFEVIDADGPDNIPGTPDDNTVAGRGIDYDTSVDFFVRPGILLVSGDGTAVTFEDKVVNGGVISIGPFGNVVNFLGDFENNGTIDVAINGLTLEAESAYLTVAGGVSINGGTFALTPVGSALAFSEGFSLDIVSAANLSDDSLFTNLDLPAVEDGLFWDIVYDEANGEIRAEVIASLAVGGDFSGDGLVTQTDVDIWIRNVGIESGASAIMGDVDLDGDVDLADYDLLMVQLQQGTPTLVGTPAAGATVPEPTTLVLLALAGIGAIAQRR